MKKFLTAFLLVYVCLMPNVSSAALDYSNVAFQCWGDQDDLMKADFDFVIDKMYGFGPSSNPEGTAAMDYFWDQIHSSQKQYGVVTITNDQLGKALRGLFNMEFYAERRGANVGGLSFTQISKNLKDNFQTMWKNGVYHRNRALRGNTALCKEAGCADIDNKDCKVTIKKYKNGGFYETVDCESQNGCFTDTERNGDASIIEGKVICKGRIKWYDSNLQEIKSEERCKNVLISNFLKSERNMGYITNLEMSGFQFDFGKRETNCSGNDMCVMNIPYTGRSGGKGYFSTCLKVDLSACDDLRADLFVGTEVINFKQTTGGKLTLQECKEAQK